MKSSRSPISSSLNTWVLVDEGNAFVETQCLGLIEALDFPAHFHRVSLPTLWRYIPHFLLPGLLKKATSRPKPLKQPWPTLIICGGPIALKLGSALRKKQTAFLISLDTSLNFSSDMQIYSSDRIAQKDKKIMTLGPMHRISPESLLQARQHTYRKVDHLPKPRVGVFLSAGDPLAPLLDMLIKLHKKSPISLMIHCHSMSVENQQMCEQILSKIPYILWKGEGQNPYVGFLAHSDAVIVSNTSPLLVAEATSTRKPLFIYQTATPTAYVKSLLQKGYAFPLTSDTNLFPHVYLPPLQEADRVAHLIKEAYFKTISS